MLDNIFRLFCHQKVPVIGVIRGENSGTFSLKMGKTPHPTPTKNFFSIT
ncbi:hypothetical protein [Microcystis aeruginosa]|nr:hypothetical protein [Microcystis aeruginosa]